MAQMFPIGHAVTVTEGEHTGKTGKVRAYTDLAKADIIHVITLDEPMMVPNGTPNPINQHGQPIHGPGGPEPREFKVEWIEAPGSCLK
jgi:hypothetical protein